VKYGTNSSEQWVEVTLSKMLSQRFQNEFPDGIILDFNDVAEDMRLSKFLPSDFRPRSFSVNSVDVTNPRRNVFVIPKFADVTVATGTTTDVTTGTDVTTAEAGTSTPEVPVQVRCRTCRQVYDVHKQYDHPWEPDNEPARPRTPPQAKEPKFAAPIGSGLCGMCGCDREGCAKYDHTFTPV